MAINASVMQLWKFFSYSTAMKSRHQFDDQEKIIIDVASGKVSRIELSEWINKHMVARNDPP
jgi:hypothetical protein